MVAEIGWNQIEKRINEPDMNAAIDCRERLECRYPSQLSFGNRSDSTSRYIDSFLVFAFA